MGIKCRLTIHVYQGRRKHQGIGPANTPKQLINYWYLRTAHASGIRRNMHMTINKQRQEKISNKHLRKIRQQYSTHPRAASCSHTPSMHAVREGTRCCAESTLAGSLIMKFITLASTLVPRLRYLRDIGSRGCGTCGTGSGAHIHT